MIHAVFRPRESREKFLPSFPARQGKIEAAPPCRLAPFGAAAVRTRRRPPPGDACAPDGSDNRGAAALPSKTKAPPRASSRAQRRSTPGGRDRSAASSCRRSSSPAARSSYFVPQSLQVKFPNSVAYATVRVRAGNWHAVCVRNIDRKHPEEARWHLQFAMQRAASFRCLRGFTANFGAPGRLGRY